MKRIAVIIFAYIICVLAEAQNLCLHYDRPAEHFEEALPIGNGGMGAMIYGGTEQCRISLNDITLWTGEPERDVFSPGAYVYVDSVRDLLNHEDYRGADRMQRHIQGHYSENYQPLGNCLITFGNIGSAEKVSDYHRQLDISRAVASYRYRTDGNEFSSEAFASAPDSVIVLHFHSDIPFCASVGFESQLPHTTVANDGELISDGYAAYHSIPNYVGSKFDYDENRGIHFRTIIKVIGNNTRSRNVDGAASVEMKDETDVTILIANVTSFNGFDMDPVREGRDYRRLVRTRIDAAAGKSWTDIRDAHIADYQTYFNRVSLDLGKTDSDIAALPTDRQLYDYTAKNQRNPELETLYFQYGRYLLISCSRTIGVPANLQGLWNESLLPPWSCNYTANINLEENYWAVETANIGEMHLPMLSFLKNTAITGHTTAHEYYGIDNGWCLAHNTDIWAMTCPVGEHGGSPQWANWNMGGAWTSTHIWEHYSFSQDRHFLKDYYPVLKGAAQFCMDWLIEKDSVLMTSPSTSPENVFLTDKGVIGQTLYGGSADIAMIRECLTCACKAAKVLGVDRKWRRQVETTISRLLPYRIGKKGNLQEWYYDWDDPEPQHRHQSHLFGLYPGHQFEDMDSGTIPYQDYSLQQLRDACAKTLEIKGDNSTGWSTGWRVNLYARLGDAVQAYHIYRKLLRYVSPDGSAEENYSTGGGTYPNLFDSHSPFQIDGNFGGCAGVVEMLMQSTDKSITLLPALPKDWRDGKVSGIKARGGFEVSMEWKDGKVISFTVYSRTGGTTTVRCNGTSHTVRLKAGGKVSVSV